MTHLYCRIAYTLPRAIDQTDVKIQLNSLHSYLNKINYYILINKTHKS